MAREQPLRVVLIGTDCEVRVWEALMQIPMGKLATYSGIAGRISAPKAARAVGAAVGKNPISFVVPCHRVVGKSGEADRLLTGALPASGRCWAGKRGRSGQRRKVLTSQYKDGQTTAKNMPKRASLHQIDWNVATEGAQPA